MTPTASRINDRALHPSGGTQAQDADHLHQVLPQVAVRRRRLAVASFVQGLDQVSLRFMLGRLPKADCSSAKVFACRSEAAASLDLSLPNVARSVVGSWPQNCPLQRGRAPESGRVERRARIERSEDQ